MDSHANAGTLTLVATPLGNLGDITRRALEVLTKAEVIYCEDTRRTRELLSALGIPSGRRLVSLHAHNEAELAERVVADVAAARQVALVSDAGTPGISDPGTRVVAAVVAAGLHVSTTPGPSAVIGALCVSGLDTERFVMEGFVPRRAGERRERFAAWAREERTIVAFESPQRLQGTLDELAGLFAQRRGVVVRELTKLHEEVVRGTLAELAAAFRLREVRGEIVLLLAGEEASPVAQEAVREALREHLEAGMSVRDAVTEVVASLGAPHRETYELALALRTGPSS